MRHVFLILFVIFSVSVSGQDIIMIRKSVEQINKTRNYTVKTVPNEYFAGKNTVTDNGIELKGFYKNSELKKMEYSVGTSAWKYQTEYFFDHNHLIFVYVKKYQTAGKNGYLRQPELLSESRYYYINRKLIKATGTSDQDLKNTDYLRQAIELRNDLESYRP